MAYPENPESIILKNEYYPSGLKEIDIYNYYQSVKDKLLNETRLRDIMFFIGVDINQVIVKRKTNENYIRLTKENYDYYITGRTVSIHSTMNYYETFGSIDVDISEYDGFQWAKRVTYDTYNYVMDHIPIIKTVKIKFTGKNSFHLICDFGRKMRIETINDLLFRFLRNSPLSKVYTISGKRRPGVPNLDLHPNKYRGAFITLHSLSTIGLKCMEIPYHELGKFTQKDAIVKG